MKQSSYNKNCINSFIACIAVLFAIGCNSAIKNKDEFIETKKTDEAIGATTDKMVIGQTTFPLCTTIDWENYVNNLNIATITGTRGNHSKEEIAAYICKTGNLPDFYMTFNACKLANHNIECTNVNREPLKDHMIGGDVFQNYIDTITYDSPLPPLPIGSYKEADAFYDSTVWHRGSHRLVYSFSGNTCHVYYTNQHYSDGSFCKFPDYTRP